MPAYNFKKQFAPAVESGQKRCTIRLRRKRPTQVGDQLKLFTGMRTKNCLLLCEQKCQELCSFEITQNNEVLVDGQLLSREELHTLARADGFLGAYEFIDFFRQTYGLPFKDAEIIRW